MYSRICLVVAPMHGSSMCKLCARGLGLRRCNCQLQGTSTIYTGSHIVASKYMRKVLGLETRGLVRHAWHGTHGTEVTQCSKFGIDVVLCAWWSKVDGRYSDKRVQYYLEIST